MAISWRTDFPGGNGLLLDVDESSRRPVVRFAAEPRNCPQAMWFHFRLAGLGGRGATVVLANPEQTLGGADWSKNSPVARAGRGDWRRLGPPRRVETPGGRVEWAWDIDAAGGTVEAALCYPYQPADLDATVEELAGAFQTEFIGLTLAGRPMTRVFNRLPTPETAGVFLTARHHAGEVPGSWVLDGLMRHVTADKALRERIAWWAVPFVDLDDVAEGSYGKDPFPHDCNRSYGPGGPRRPEGAAVARDAQRMGAACGRMFFADLHAPGHAERATYVPVRGWEPASPINPIGHEFAERFAAATPEDLRSPKAFIVPRPGSNAIYAGWPASRWATEGLGADAICLEVSYQGTPDRDYSQADYHRLGAALAETLAEWVRR